MIVLDTTVLVYAKGAQHPLREPSRRLIEAVTERELQATTTVKVIQELVQCAPGATVEPTPSRSATIIRSSSHRC
ncbi:MAG: hypothetical protein ACLQBY_17865 [Solirubrobacteraceae bacterium]